MTDKNIITKYLEQSRLYKELVFFGITLEPVMNGTRIIYKGFHKGNLFCEKEFNFPSDIYYDFSNYDISFEWVVTTVLRVFLRQHVSSDLIVDRITFKTQKDSQPDVLVIQADQVLTKGDIQARIELSIHLDRNEPTSIYYEAAVSYKGVVAELVEELCLGNMTVTANVTREISGNEHLCGGRLVENYKFKHEKSLKSMMSAIKGFIQYIENKEIKL